jgi:hypothetical protein
VRIQYRIMTTTTWSNVARIRLVLILTVFAVGAALLTATRAQADPYHACGMRGPTSSNDSCYQSWSAGQHWAVTVLRQRPYGTVPQLTADQALGICRNGIAEVNPNSPARLPDRVSRAVRAVRAMNIETFASAGRRYQGQTLNSDTRRLSRRPDTPPITGLRVR